jgi:hypothetical protein
MASLTTTPTPYEELVIGLVTEGRTPEEIIAFRATPEAQRRVEELIAKEHAGTITAEESSELDSHMQFNHLVILLKARATEMQASQQKL